MILYRGNQHVATVTVRDAVRWSRSADGQRWLASLPRQSATDRVRSLMVCIRCDKFVLRGRCLCGVCPEPRRVYLAQHRSVCSDSLCARRSGHRGLHTWERRVLNSRNPMEEFKS